MTDSKPNLIVLVGATASGKTAIAIELAKRLDGEIISADSRYFFKDLQIGTAKPSFEQRSQVRHHLIDVTTLAAPWSLGEFRTEAESLILDINSRGKVPILVGGSGQYIRAITENWTIPAQEPDHGLRLAIENWGKLVGFDRLHTQLSWIDAQAARVIDPRNHRRTVRALEVIFLSGQRFSELRQTSGSKYCQLIIGLDWPRGLLYKRIDERIDLMLSNGLVAEVEQVLASGMGKQLRRVGIIGYTEILDYLEGKSTLEEAVMLIRRNTRRFIRHQSNWFKPDNPDIHWFNAQDPDTIDQMLGLIQDRFAQRLTEAPGCLDS
ncbi:MAG: tRNA (adenosine(37)-N6)-dimethylallyltransferase MiaA [Anaerolineaceae bacterium]